MTPSSSQLFPYNTAERIFNVVCLIFGMLLFSSLTSLLSSKLIGHNRRRQSRGDALSVLRRFARQVGISSERGVRIEESINAQMAREKPLVLEDVQLLSTIPCPCR